MDVSESRVTVRVPDRLGLKGRLRLQFRVRIRFLEAPAIKLQALQGSLRRAELMAQRRMPLRPSV